MSSKIQSNLNSKLRFDNQPKLWLRIKLNEVQMLKERGYDIDDEEKFKAMTPEEFEQYAEKNKLDYIYNNPLTNRKLLVHYIRTPGTRDVGHDAILYFISQLVKDSSIDSGIIISKNISSAGYSRIKTFPAYHIQHFTPEELVYDVSQHFFVPKQTIVTKEEMFKSGPKYKIALNQLLPVILKNLHASDEKKTNAAVIVGDPIIKRLGAKHGDIIKVERVNFFSSVMVENSIAFRIVKEIK